MLQAGMLRPQQFERSERMLRWLAVPRMSETSKALTVGIVFASSQARGKSFFCIALHPKEQVPGFHPALAGLFDYLSLAELSKALLSCL